MLLVWGSGVLDAVGMAAVVVADDDDDVGSPTGSSLTRLWGAGDVGVVGAILVLEGPMGARGR